MTEESLRQVVDQAHQNGFNLWDTALVYGMGHSEVVLGDVLQGHDRSSYELSTKFTPQIAGSGSNPVADMLEQSLTNLRTDYLDWYWIHNPADVTRWTKALIPVLQSGKIRHLGVSNHNIEQIELAQQILSEAGFGIEGIQNHYSLLYRSSEDAGVLDFAAQHNMRFFAYMVLEQGALTGRYSPENPLPAGTARAEAYNDLLPQLKALNDKLAALGEPQGASGADVAIAWALAKGTTPIIGVTKPHYIDSLVRARSLKLSVDDVAELAELADAANVNTRGSWENEM